MGFWGAGILENDVVQDIRAEFESMIQRGTTVEDAVEHLIDTQHMDRKHDDPYLALCNAVQVLGLAWFAMAKTDTIPERLARLVYDVVDTSAYVDQYDGEEGETAFRQQEHVVAVMEGRRAYPEDGELDEGDADGGEGNDATPDGLLNVFPKSLRDELA